MIVKEEDNAPFVFFVLSVAISLGSEDGALRSCLASRTLRSPVTTATKTRAVDASTTYTAGYLYRFGDKLKNYTTNFPGETPVQFPSLPSCTW
jgi:hypothetical protein